MSSKSILYTTLVLAIVGMTAHFMAESFYFYWTLWWWDVLVHFLVGTTGGFGLYWGLFRSGIIFRQEFQNTAATVMTVFVCVMAWGVGWEVFEYVNSFTDSHEGYRIDTINDLILDGSGAVLACLFTTRKKKVNV